ncbi:MAG TPA: UDP-glucose/GDP-mannose dehydrogenase family protein [Candidatus Acidoferrum sp.]|nr:UDP-glucose/GDP-mannose dehydrogenase family protein [Candidatus Acidoferrum sp.]
MNICVVGSGYVGLVTGAVFADLGNDVVCVDNLADKIEALKAGHVPIYEPGLEEMIVRNTADGRLSFTTDLTAAVRRSVIVFITVGTPSGKDGQTDLGAVEEVAREIGQAMERYTVIVNKSTVPVGTGEFVRDVIERHQSQTVPFDVVSNPEFLREGSAIEDTLRPDRIVIGAPTQQVAMTLLELYAPLERPMIITDVPSAEMIKYASNAYLATKISFANAIANICEAAGADVTQVVKGMGLDTRIGPAFLQAGLGYGGSCFPKDTDSLIHTADDLGYDFGLLRAVVDVNRERASHLVAKIEKALAPLDGKVVAVLGLAFKPNTDDMREAKSIEVVLRLVELGVEVRAYDPVAMTNARRVLPSSVTYCDSAHVAAEGADAVVLLTEWNEFKLLNLERLRGVMRRPVIFDGRNLWEPERMRRLGFEYHSIGRPPVVTSERPSSPSNG